jgi:hypothetical protein
MTGVLTCRQRQQRTEQEADMSRNWLRHHVDAQDGQIAIRKIVVSPTVASPSNISGVTDGGKSMTPQQARAIVERAKAMREARRNQQQRQCQDETLAR